MKNKQIDDISNIISNSEGVFIENFTMFFSNAEKNVNVLEFEFERF